MIHCGPSLAKVKVTFWPVWKSEIICFGFPNWGQISAREFLHEVSDPKSKTLIYQTFARSKFRKPICCGMASAKCFEPSTKFLGHDEPATFRIEDSQMRVGVLKFGEPFEQIVGNKLSSSQSAHFLIGICVAKISESQIHIWSKHCKFEF